MKAPNSAITLTPHRAEHRLTSDYMSIQGIKAMTKHTRPALHKVSVM